MVQCENIPHGWTVLYKQQESTKEIVNGNL